MMSERVTAAAARAGYGKIKEVVVITDGAVDLEYV